MPTYSRGRYRRRYPVRYRTRRRRAYTRRYPRYGATQTRKTYRRKAYSSYTNKWIPTSLTPKTKLIKLKWCRRVSWNPGAGGVILMDTYGANTPYDPSQTGGAPAVGMQPVGWDQCADVYGRYIPLSSKITWQMCDMSSDVGSVMFQCFLTHSSTLRGITDLQQATCEPIKKSRLKVFGNPERYSVNFRGGKLTYSGKKYWSVKDLIQTGVNSDPVLQNTAITGDLSVNGKVYYHLCLQAINPAVDIAEIFGVVKISYIILFHEFNEHEDAAE